LRKFGTDSEFIGRFPVLAPLNLWNSFMIKVLTEPKNALYANSQLFAYEGVELKFEHMPWLKSPKKP